MWRDGRLQPRSAASLRPGAGSQSRSPVASVPMPELLFVYRGGEDRLEPGKRPAAGVERAGSMRWAGRLVDNAIPNRRVSLSDGNDHTAALSPEMSNPADPKIRGT